MLFQEPPPPGPRDRQDETRAPDGSVRAHWASLLEAWQDVSPEQWQRWQESAQQRIHEHGVTYNVYADPQGAARPWALDIVPLLLPDEEWAHIEAAVAQRAQLLDRVLADLYGPQQLLYEKLLPTGLIYAHNGYLWPCRGIAPPGGRFLHLYAADIARAPDGRWWVLADRTQAPSGAGYALENRQIVGSLFPDWMETLGVRAPDDWYRTLQHTLLSQAPVDPGETPLVVLLTPGPHNETWFEHVYLARQLGFALAEGSDLTVRGDTLYLKTLAGLQRVHALLRRLDDTFCDPLDLRADSTLGVAGLVEVARAGRVLIANALGSGVLESAGLPGFLPSLCERLFNEPLKMPSVASWWCGEAAARAWVEEHLERLVIKPAYPSQRMEPIFGDRLCASARESLIARLRARPNAYVAQELVHLSQAPALVSDLTTGELPAVQPRAIGLRVYAVATADGGYRVLPGGLARVAGDTSLDVVSMQHGGSSKDVWVTGAAASVTLPPQVFPPPSPPRHALSSRVAENLYWLGRYVERATAQVRLAQAILHRHETVDGNAAERLQRLQALAFHLGCQAEPLASPAALFDGQWAGALPFTLGQAGRAGAAVRASLSPAYRRALERAQECTQDLVRRAQEAPWRPEPAQALLTRLLMLLDRLSPEREIAAAADEAAVSRDNDEAGHHFLRLGRAVERAQGLSATAAFLLDAPAGSAAASLVPELAGLDAAAGDWPTALELLVRADETDTLVATALQVTASLDWLAQTFGSLPEAGLDAAVAVLKAQDFAPTLAGEHAAALSALHGLHAAAVTLSARLSDRFLTHIDERTRRWLAV